MKPTQEQIDRMKQNKEAFMFWPKELQDWAQDNNKQFIFVSGDEKTFDTLHKDGAYRLRPNFILPPEKRWFVNINSPCNGHIYIVDDNNHAYYTSKVDSGEMIEIHESELQYLNNRPKDHQLSKPMFGDRCIESDGSVRDVHAIPPLDTFLAGYRWCKVPVKKVGRWVDYKIEARENVYFLITSAGQRYMALTTAQCRVGFGGVWFEGANEWSMHTRCYINNGTLHIYDNGEVHAQLAVPVKARFWVEG